VRHFASSSFWDAYRALPPEIQRLADRCFEQLKSNPAHRSLRFKRVGRYRSVRVGLYYRALGVEAEEGAEEGVVWFWIGTHAAYDKLIRG
jgi:hypothetical protein